MRTARRRGFIRPTPRPKEAEIVVLGERERRGGGLGARALGECFKLLFLLLRAAVAAAHIHPNNARSLLLFLKAGFRAEAVKPGAPSCALRWMNT